MPPDFSRQIKNCELKINFSLASSSSRLADGVELKIRIQNTTNLLTEKIESNLITSNKNFKVNKIALISDSENLKINNSKLSFGSLKANEEKEVEQKPVEPKSATTMRCTVAYHLALTPKHK